FDDPQLNVRDWSGKNPLRIVLDKDLRLPDSLRMFNDGDKTLIYTSIKKENTRNKEYVNISFDNKLINHIISDLYDRNVQSVFIEGGKTLIESFISCGLWDEARVIVGNTTFGKGIECPKIDLPTFCIEDIEDNKLLTYRNPNWLPFSNKS
ncbi:MAG: dihydrofolate reductase family protein, partial [Flavobacteriales bacterium]|nr:dihydrofolate reductase family protein [Flavobacteriales bacterium]